MKRVWRRIRRSLAADDGSSLILIIGVAALALLLVLGLMAATSLLLERRQLFTLADGAAVVAAESFTIEQLADGSGRPVPILDEEAMHTAVEGWVAAVDHTGEVALIDVRTADSETAVVVLGTRWRPPALRWMLPDGIRIEVTVTARSVFGQ